ncbi:MAG: Gfo/Idh/MocA family oxidoreductase [Verrucomicrobiaceae bacterium]|nr:Gfo/Idh/MocA family oxidoreductase [Verrucomicrobiaceae bacterium]
MPDPSSSSLSVAFIGAGGMNREHSKAFASLPGAKLAGIHSRTRGKAETLAAECGIPLVADSIAELHEATKADLLVIAVPEMSIRAVAEQAFQFPWTILMEKPPGKDLEEALHLESLAQKHGRTVYVGLNRRFLGSTEAVLDDIHSRNEPRFVRVEDQQSLETARVIGHPEEIVQRWMYANSIHLMDYLRSLCRGSVKKITPITPWRPDAPSYVLAAVEFDSGDVGLYESTWNGPGPWTVTVNTPGRRWELRPLEQAKFINAGERALNEVPQTDNDKSFKPGFRRQAEEVLKALRGVPNRAPTLASAIETMRLISTIFQVA